MGRYETANLIDSINAHPETEFVPKGKTEVLVVSMGSTSTQMAYLTGGTGRWKGSSSLTDVISAKLCANGAEYGLMELGARAMEGKTPKKYADKLKLAVIFWKEIITYMLKNKCNVIFRNAACYAWGHDTVSMTYAAFAKILDLQRRNEVITQNEEMDLQTLSQLRPVNMFPLVHTYNPLVNFSEICKRFSDDYKTKPGYEDARNKINSTVTKWLPQLAERSLESMLLGSVASRISIFGERSKRPGRTGRRKKKKVTGGATKISTKGEGQSTRRMAQREFPSRRDSPVMVRLLQQIVDAQDKEN